MDKQTLDAITSLAETVTSQGGRLTSLTETVAALSTEMRAGFARTDRIARLENEVVLLRDHVTREIADIKIELRALRARSDQTDELRRQIAELTMRVDLLEQRNQG